MEWSISEVPKHDAFFYGCLKEEFFIDRKPYASTITGILSAACRNYHRRTWGSTAKRSRTYNEIDGLLIERIVTYYGGPSMDAAEALYKQDRDAFKALDYWYTYSTVLLDRAGPNVEWPL